MNETKKAPEGLGFKMPISETALLTLYFKAQETQRPDRLIEDPKAVEILEKLGVDMSRFQNKKIFKLFLKRSLAGKLESPSKTSWTLTPRDNAGETI